ncbi:MAG: hypothetical protein JXO51_02945 [Candidatus Aminicenantes bacterium]|nr:hypothetical protein [Candidatus Aminicenantes bacterium]
MTRPLPSCPACGSSATLPFENEEGEESGPAVAEVVLGALFVFLSLLAVLLFFLLTRAGPPAAVLLLATLYLLWRRKKEQRQRAERRRRDYVCLDCSRHFRA